MHRAMLAASLKASVAWCAPLVLASACCLSASNDALIGFMPTSKHSQMTCELLTQADQRGTQGCKQWVLEREQACILVHGPPLCTAVQHPENPSYCIRLLKIPTATLALRASAQSGFLAELLLYILLCHTFRYVCLEWRSGKCQANMYC